MKPVDDTQHSLARIEAAAARGAAAAFAARPQESPGWQAIAVVLAILGSIVWFGTDFSGRLGRMEGQLTILMQAVQDGRGMPGPSQVSKVQPASPTGQGNTSAQDARNGPGS